MPQTASVLRSWPVLVPALSVVGLVLTWGRDLGPAALVAAAALLAGAVLAAVHHAEVVALRVGEPYGSLILAVAVTVIEVALFALTVVVGVLNVTPGRATLLQAGVHLALFAGFLVLAVSP
jgi:Ca2+:H+ antiporter